MKNRFIDLYTPNKQIVMEEMYHAASRYIHQKDAVILPSEYPFRPLRRLYRYGIIGKKNNILGYELEKEKCMGWFSREGNSKRRNIFEVEERLKKAGYPAKIGKNIHFFVGSVAECPPAHLIDLDFCRTWLGQRNREGELDEVNSSIGIMTSTIHKQINAIGRKDWKALLGTVSLRNSKGGKSLSHKCIDYMTKTITGNDKAYTLIDGDRFEYGKGIILEGACHLRDDGKIFHAYEHDVDISIDFDLKIKLYTYTDTTPMLSFCMLYK